MAAKIFTVPFASGGDITPAIPDATQSDGSLSYTTGYGPDYERQLGVDPLAKNISRASFNAALNDITTALQSVQAGIILPWNQALVTALGGLPIGALVAATTAANGYWQNTVAGNTTNPEGASPAGWTPISGLAIAAKAPLASPIFTGNPTGPTAAVGDNDTSLANTAFVQAALGAWGVGSYAVSTSDLNTLGGGGSGFFRCISTANGVPVASPCLAVYEAYNATSGVMTAKTFTTPVRVFERRYNASAWEAWTELSSVASVQSGAATFGTDTGAANAYVVAFTPAITARAEGQVLRFKVKTTNTGASTFNDGVSAAPLVGGAHAALQGGELFANGDAWVQWNSSVGAGSYILLFCTGGAEQVGPASQSQHAVQLAQMAAVVGGTRNGKMAVTAASATATFTADEVAVKTALGGPAWLLNNFNKTVNLATTGAGGMDTGTAPVSGFVGLYAIYNPTTGVSALLAVNATAAVLPEVYGGANVPAGYTASALLTVVPTNASSQFATVVVKDRSVWITPVQVINTTTQQASLTSLSVSAAIPLNANMIDASAVIAGSTAGVTLTTTIAGSNAAGGGLGQKVLSVTNNSASSGIQAQLPHIPVITAQTLFYSCTVGSGTMAAFGISISNYSI